MIILVGSQKGGSGKSTIATNIAASLAKNKKDVILVDADRQGTASNWAQDRSETTLSHLESVSKYDNIKKTLRDLDNRYEFVIVDSQGRDSTELRTGLLVADICIVPCRPSQADLDTIPVTKYLIDTAKDINENMQVFCVLTQSPTNPSITEMIEARDYLSEYPELKLLNTIISERKVYRDALASGYGVAEMDNDKAKSEIENFLNEIGL